MKIRRFNGTSWVQEYPEVDVDSIVATGTPSSTTFLRGDGAWAVPADVDNFLPLTGGTLTGTLTSRSINMQNYTLSNVGQMSFNDPGPNEGISWSGGNFKIYESPNDLSTNSAGNLQFVSGGSRRLTVQTDGTVYAPGAIQSGNSVSTPIVQTTGVSDRTKIRTWSGSSYGIGMQSSFTYGGLNDYAMTFQMNDDNDRGFWWGDGAHTGAQGAMALTTAGQLTVADKIRVGYGQSDTTTPSTYSLDAEGNIQANELHLNDANTILKEGSNNSVRIQTNNGYVDVGPQNTGFSHFSTDIGRFYFNKGADFDGDIRAYSNNTTKIEESTGYIYELGDRVATRDYVDTEVANLVDSSPDALNTLNELAAALGDDENFSTTMTTSLAGKVAKSGDTMTGNLSIENSGPQLTLKDTTDSDDINLSFTNSSNSQVANISTAGNRLNINTTFSNGLSIDADKVGIGITSPQTKLHIVGPDSDGSAATLRVGGPSNGTGNNTSKLELAEATTNSNADMHYGFSFTADGSNTNNFLLRSHNNSTTGVVGLSQSRATGNVGIKTSGPSSSYALDVNGDVRANRYYDGNNTDYYVDPASTSELNAVNANRVVSENETTTPDEIGNIKIARLHGTTTAISDIDNLESFILSKTDGGYGSGTKPSGTHNGFGVISLQTHTGDYFTQIGLDTNQNALWTRSADGVSSYGSWQRVFADDYHPNADKWTTARTLELTGDVTGSVSWDGSANASLSTTISGGGGYTHPTHPGDDISIDTGALTGATVISDLDFNVTSDTQGHITDANATVSTRNLTASDIGAAAASHTHDDRYYTESEADTLLAAKAASSHGHGNLTSAGGWSSSPATIGSGDYVIIGDSSDSSKLRQSSTQFGTSTTTYLRNDGTFANPISSNTVIGGPGYSPSTNDILYYTGGGGWATTERYGYWKEVKSRTDTAILTSTGSNGATSGTIYAGSSADFATGDTIMMEVSRSSSVTTRTPNVVIFTLGTADTTPTANEQSIHLFTEYSSTSYPNYVYTAKVSHNADTLYFDDTYVTRLRDTSTASSILYVYGFTLYVGRIWRLVQP